MMVLTESSSMMSQLYDNQKSKFELLQPMEVLKSKSQKDETLLLESSALIKSQGTINRYHCVLLYRQLKESFPEKEIVCDLIAVLCQLLDVVKQSGDLCQQWEYLKLLHALYKVSGFKNNPIVSEQIIRWYAGSTDFVLEKQFLKLVGIFVHTFDIGNALKLLNIFITRSYNTILFDNTVDFLTQRTDSPTFVHQARVLNICLNILIQHLPSGSPELVALLNKTVSGDTRRLRGYILSVVAGDDYQLLSCLTTATYLSTVLSESKPLLAEFPFYQPLAELCCAYSWIICLASHIKFDQKVIIDWLMDEQSGCEEYLTTALPLLSADFERFASAAKDTGLDAIMSFLIRLSLQIEEDNEGISSLISEVEVQYESYLSYGQDPLDAGNLSDQLASTCTISLGTAGLVGYSDSDDSSGDDEEPT